MGGRRRRVYATGELNHIAHFLLAPHTEDGAIGTLLADFHRGPIGSDLPDGVASAIALHRAIDGHVDRHPVVADARSRFAPGHRRHAGVALDLYFDHCLVRKWPRHAAIPFDAFIGATYRRLRTGIDRGDLPPPTHRFTRAMIADDWLRAFARFDGVEAALGRLNFAIRRRFGRDVDLRPLAGELQRLEQPLDDAFDALFADLVGFAQRWSENRASR